MTKGPFVRTLKVREVPVLQLGLLETKVLRHWLGLLTLLCNSKSEAVVQRQPNEFGAVSRLMDLKTDVEVLASEEVGPECKLAIELCRLARSYAQAPQEHAYWSGGNTQPVTISKHSSS